MIRMIIKDYDGMIRTIRMRRHDYDKLRDD